MAGIVYLVGAGPGDPGLITVRGTSCLAQADIVLYDRLVDPRLLEHAPEQAQRVYVGKGPSQRAMEQEEINRYLVEQACQGKRVVRLKGGDPFVFGRGGEEALALEEAGIPFEIVPGVTSAIAVPAYAGISLTHRAIASSFTVVTGNEDPSKADSHLPWQHLANTEGTLVVLMGAASLERTCHALVEHGMSPATPAALVHWGTRAAQRTLVGTVGDLHQRAQEANLGPPVVAVIGEVVGLREKLRWFDNRPLFGLKVLVTRSRAQASSLCQLLSQEGALPVEVPAIAISPIIEGGDNIDSALQNLERYSWVVFTSVNGVEIFFDRLMALRRDSRALGGAKVAAIGPATAQALARRGIVADLVPRQYLSQAVVQAMEKFDLSGARVLLPRAEIGGPDLAQGLESLGAVVDQRAIYNTELPHESRQKALDALQQGIDVATFTSSSTVRNLLELLGGERGLLDGVKVACIGPQTAETARQSGLKVDLMASQHTVPGLVEALKEYYANRRHQ